ncbi:hypothetical protein OAE35_03075 [Synechococcus sp. AH-551-E02]|nr:hypothetical protein [Synechococcus sp. AH-551-E02]MDB4653863.1 hypothetical protein [Synechococcus sp. AH-551-E02]
MVDAIVGAVIMVMATTSLIFAIEVAESAFDQAGRYPLNEEERDLLNNAGLDNVQVDAFWANNLKDSPREVGP